MLDFLDNLFSEDTLKVIDAFGSWISGLGAMLAVVVSLYLSREASRPRAKISISVLEFFDGIPGNTQSFLGANITNIGNRPLKVTNIGWRWGLPFRRRHAIQLIFPGQLRRYFPNQPPHDLSEGEQVTFVITCDPEKWADDFSKSLMTIAPSWLSVKLLKFSVHTSYGHDFYVPLTKALRQILITSLKTRKEEK